MVRMLGDTGIAENCSLVVEKPFGHDRIDHFLGKEAAQNILALRFANGIFEPIWNRDHISYVQIDVPEAIDIQGRAGFYEQTGAFRDMVVTHLLQILGIVALEPPSRVDAEALHLERTKPFDSVRPIDPDRVVFGQYEGYRDVDDVGEDSRVETFAALEVRVDTWRWSGGAVLPADRQVDGGGAAYGDDRVHRGPVAPFPSASSGQRQEPASQRARVRALRRPDGQDRSAGQEPRSDD